eukprot:gene8019-16434_t
MIDSQRSLLKSSSTSVINDERIKNNKKKSVEELMSRALSSDPITNMAITMTKSSSIKVISEQKNHRKHSGKYYQDERSISEMSDVSSVNSNPFGPRSFYAQSVDSASDTSSINSTKMIERGKLHGMILAISKHVQNDLPPPEFVPRFDEMANIWSTSKKQKKDPLPPVHENIRSMINVIGCNQTIDIILAKADERARKQKQALKLKENACQEKIDHITQVIELKQTRAQKYTKELNKQQIQFTWLKLIKFINFIRRTQAIFEFLCRRITKLRQVGIQKETLRGKVRIWSLRARHKKYTTFFSKIGRAKARFVMYIRVWKRRKAAKTLQHFLTESKDNEVM